MEPIVDLSQFVSLEPIPMPEDDDPLPAYGRNGWKVALLALLLVVMIGASVCFCLRETGHLSVSIEPVGAGDVTAQ